MAAGSPAFQCICLRPSGVLVSLGFYRVFICCAECGACSVQGVTIARPPPFVLFIWSTFEPPEKFRAPCLGPSPLTCVRPLLCPASPSRSCPAPLLHLFLPEGGGPLPACTPAAGLALGASKMQGFSSEQILGFVSFSCSKLGPVSKVIPKNMLISLNPRTVGL